MGGKKKRGSMETKRKTRDKEGSNEERKGVEVDRRG